MGLLVDGVWQQDSSGKEFGARTEGGQFIRRPTVFHNYVTADGRPGPTGIGGFAAERGRYHLYVSLACPWAHRTLIFRKLKKLEDVISVSVTEALLGKKGWEFGTEPGATLDTVNGKPTLAEIYVLADPHYSGRASVPVLWDKKQRTIVNNESSEIIRMLNSAFDAFTDVRTDYYPAELRSEIDRINELVYSTVNNGVYRAGFATTQVAYEEAARALVRDARSARGASVAPALSRRAADHRGGLAALHNAHSFRCGLLQPLQMQSAADHRLSQSIGNYLRELYQVPGVAETVSLDHIKRHYYGSHRNVNPTGIVPIGPVLDFMLPHDRGRFG